MAYFPFGVHPPDPPDWFRTKMEEAGFNANEIPLWFLGEARDFTVPAALLLTLPPGYVLGRHGHPCFRFEIVVQGTLDAATGKMAGPGDVFTARPGDLYGPHTAGLEGCTTIEIFSELDGMFRLLYETSDGGVGEADIRKGEFPPNFTPFPDQSNVRSSES